MARPRRADGPQGRPQRTPVGQRDILTVPESVKEEGFEYRFFNTAETGRDAFRVQQAIKAGWTPVDEKAQVGDPNVGQASQFGSVAGKPVDGGKSAVLMKIPSEWFREDQAAKEALIKQNVQGLLLDEKGRQPDQETVYGEGIKTSSSHKMPVIQED